MAGRAGNRGDRGSSSRTGGQAPGGYRSPGRRQAAERSGPRSALTSAGTGRGNGSRVRATARTGAFRQSRPASSREGTAFSATPGGRRSAGSGSAQVTSRTVGEIRRAERRERLEQARKKSRRRLIRIAALIAVVAALAVGGVALYNSSAFTIEHVSVNGVEHLTSEEMAQLANVPVDSTLLRVDTSTIEKRVRQNAWVADVQVHRAFPDTLEINVTERAIAAIVEVPTSAGASVKQWAIADDHTWLMPIPEAGSDAAKTTSAKVYEDASHALHVTDVPFGTKAEIGQPCTDANVNNALDIISGLTTELAGRVVQVSAAGTAETTLVLDNGVEVAFGKAEDIRDKERVILKILEENPDNVSYINVRMVETPTWRAL